MEINSQQTMWTNSTDKCTISKIEKVEYDARQGFMIETTNYKHYFTIYNVQDCCEKWGCIITNDNAEEFIGATVKKITTTTKGELDLSLTDEDVSDTVFINFETNLGTLQFVAYTIHNGYYGHNVEYKKIGKAEKEYERLLG